MARLFVEPDQIGEKTIDITDKNDIHHITRVLRLREGNEIDVSDKTEWEYRCSISSVDSDLVVADIIDKQKFAKEPELKVTLFQGIPKAGKMEGIVQKCVELGVYEIVPLWTERTVVVDNKGNFSKKIDRWQKIADEAVKQCKRGIIPEISTDIKIKNLINEFVNYELILFPYENEEGTTIKDCLSSLTEKPKNVAIIIGPEGGFSDTEAEMLVEAGAKSVSLGKTILRTETAGPAALAMTMYALEL